jgi:hypothetical protein
MAVRKDSVSFADEDYMEIPRLNKGGYAKAKQVTTEQAVRAVVVSIAIVCLMVLPIWFLNTIDPFTSQSYNNRRTNNGQNWNYNNYGSGAYPQITGSVNSTQGPIDGAYVALSSVPIATTGDLETAEENDLILGYTESFSGGTFYMNDLSYVEPETNYWLVACAAFHNPNVQVVRFNKNDPTMNIDIVLTMRPMTWTMTGILSRGGGEFIFDILAESRPFERYGLRSALMNRTLNAVVTWDNDLTTGGDLEIGYAMTCMDPSSNTATQYPTQKSNQEQITIVLSPTVLEELDGCGGRSITFSVWVDNASWANDCAFTLTVSIS